MIEPPKKITQTFYLCDKRFHLESILEMFCDEHNYGIVFISGKFFEIYKVIKSGDNLDIRKIQGHSIDPLKKHNKGGQSAPRFQRLHEEKEAAYIKKVSEYVINNTFTDNKTKCTVEKLILAGPGDKKRMVAESPLITQYFPSDSMEVVNTGDINERNIISTIHNMRHLFEKDINQYYDKILNEIQNLMVIADDKLLFGIDEINKSLSEKGVQKIICDEEVIDKLNLDTDDSCEIVKIPSYKLKQVGGIQVIGIKWY